MKNSVSDHSFHTESDEEDVEKEFHEGEDDGNDSDSSQYSIENQQQHNSSYNITWPQSYRQSIDLYGSVPSSSFGILGTSPLSRFGSSSSLTKRHSLETLPSVTKPLLQPTADEQQRRSSHSLLPPLPSRRSSIEKDVPNVSREIPISRRCSYGQAVFNGINVICGVGILTTPYAAKEGGWLGLSFLFMFAVLAFYTGMLLRYCLDSEPGLETYPDIGQAAFGPAGRIVISIILYAELYACCIEFIILESDNLSSLFPNAHINLGGIELNSHILFALMTTLAVLPTVWLRDLSILSYISAGGVFASILVVLCLFWVGVVDEVGYQSKGTMLNLATLPVAVGLYGFCYSGHAVLPNIYTSMANPKQFPSVLLACFCICTLLYGGGAVMGYTMFGESTLSQFTLNMPQDFVATKIALWATVVNPFAKYALTISPVAMSLEELIISEHAKSYIYAVIIRTGLVVSTLIVGLSVPFFGLVMSLIGSLLAMLVAFILPCACFLSIRRGRVTRIQATLCTVIIIAGVVSSAFGTYSALSKIIESLGG